ncbi:hypothetical protein MYX78_11560 [Acidobacteria bacterium AH-259-G07]|nr:hypothetical protein [Acidobacteria bacterium AH-259-G07]
MNRRRPENQAEQKEWYTPFWKDFVRVSLVVLTMSAMAIPAGLYLLYKLGKEQNRQQKLQALLSLTELTEKKDLFAGIRTIYHEYVDGELTLARIRNDNLKYDTILNVFNRVATLVYHDFIEHGIVLDFFPLTTMRLWVIFEQYIREERKSRGGFMLPLEYLAQINLEQWLTQNPARRLTFYNNDQPPKTKSLDINELQEFLHRTNIDVR